MATKENLLGMASTNTSPLVAPTRAQETVFGTNPIAVRHKVLQAVHRFIISSGSSELGLIVWQLHTNI